jgi:predicted alpha/beta superfamily hydrolase
MSTGFRAILGFLVCFLAGVSAHAQAQAGSPPWPAEVATPASHRITFDSAINGESYTLFIRTPLTPPPPQGFPVIYVLDGDFWFGAASDIALSIGDPARWPVVVAIGHGVFDDMAVVARYAQRRPGDESPLGVRDMSSANNVLRFRDYTLPVSPAHRAPAWTGLTPDNVGGLDDFLEVVEREIKPKVAALVPVNADNQALFGHSIGGLAVLRALFTKPSAFRTFIAASPAIWWDGDAVLADEQAFGDKVEKGEAAPRVLMTVGANEPDSPNPPQSFIDTLPAERAAELTAYVEMAGRWSGMVSGTRNLVGRLAALPGPPPYRATFVAFDGESHASTVPAALARGIQFAFVEN